MRLHLYSPKLKAVGRWNPKQGFVQTRHYELDNSGAQELGNVS
jgi:hypothetical protein